MAAVDGVGWDDTLKITLSQDISASAPLYGKPYRPLNP